jgi:hypothetical protein
VDFSFNLSKPLGDAVDRGLDSLFVLPRPRLAFGVLIGASIIKLAVLAAIMIATMMGVDFVLGLVVPAGSLGDRLVPLVANSQPAQLIGIVVAVVVGFLVREILPDPLKLAQKAGGKVPDETGSDQT